MKNVPFSIDNYLSGHAEVLQRLDRASFQAGIDLVKRKFSEGKRVITCGNGGSAATASHYITDWNKMGNLATGGKYRGLSLCDNIGLITAYGNDLSYDEIFSGQLRSILEVGDLVIAVSGSGNSPNVIKAIEYAKAQGADTLAVVGYDGGKLKLIAHHCVWVPSFDMQFCEEMHLMFGHMVMKALCGGSIHL